MAQPVCDRQSLINWFQHQPAGLVMSVLVEYAALPSWKTRYQRFWGAKWNTCGAARYPEPIGVWER
jgi:hypothetical protein